ncbi:hypothetical protein GCM10010211_81300 [Streptomyces albospinus]|uniref:Uncharacterized protein n=1 Tax=Streptomyces albospinus TaxID=285515 RepID=A0ABQ2VND6_9ACTN|nr:hypothetical protein [Streptomyces albospinus]GGV01755.1 hypothetical protein GCM10010211_81300 [Streptomyces albospinus]
MGVKPPAAASAVVTEPASSGSDTTSVSGRFGTPHASVIIVCIATAAILTQRGMDVRDVLVLLAGAGSIGAAVVALVVTDGPRGGRIGRFLRAYFNSGN